MYITPFLQDIIKTMNESESKRAVPSQLLSREIAAGIGVSLSICFLILLTIITTVLVNTLCPCAALKRKTCKLFKDMSKNYYNYVWLS